MLKISRLFNLVKGKKNKLLSHLREEYSQPKRFQHKCDELPCGTITYQFKTGVLLIHPGEPALQCGIQKFLECIERDKNFSYNMQAIWTPEGCLRSCEDLDVIYQAVGCYSPLQKCAHQLAENVEKHLDSVQREYAPHKVMVGFRYTPPYISTALKEFEKARVRYFVVLNLEPHFCYQRAGPCFEVIAKYYSCRPLPKRSWTIVDHWPLRSLYCAALAQRIQLELDAIPKKARAEAVIVFVANNLPRENVLHGDLYPYEVGVTAMTTARMMENTHQYVLCYLPGRANCCNLRPTIDDTLQGLWQNGSKAFVVVPLTCPCTNLDSLYELDRNHLRYFRKMTKCEAVVVRTDHPNYHRFVGECLSKVVQEAIVRRQKARPQFLTRCHGTAQQCCCEYVDFFAKIMADQDANRKLRIY